MGKLSKYYYFFSDDDEQQKSAESYTGDSTTDEALDWISNLCGLDKETTLAAIIDAAMQDDKEGAAW